MKIARLKDGNVAKVVKQYEAQTDIQSFETKQVSTISNDDIIEIVKIALTFYDIVKLLISKFKDFFPKK